MEPLDKEIVQDVLAGQKDRFTLLLNRYSGLVRYFFENRWRYDPETAKDLTQEVFIRVFRNLASHSETGSFKAWLMTITRNLAIDHSRRQGKMKTTELEDRSATTDSPERGCLQKVMLEEALLKLPPRQREIMEYRYLMDLTSAEIGNLLNLPEGTVRSDLYYARLKILDLMNKAERKE